MQRPIHILARLFLIAIAVLGLSGTPARSADPARIVAVGTADSLGLQVVIDIERRVDPQVFLLNEPMRVVVDLGAARWALAQAATPQGAVAGWRYGRREDGKAARLVVDLSMPALVKRIGYDLSAPRGVARLVVDLEPSSRDAFAGSAQTWRRTSDLLRDVYVPPERRPAAAAPAVRRPATSAAPPAAPVEPPAAAAPPKAVAAPAATAPAVATASGGAQGRAGALRAPGRRIVVIDPGHGGQDPGAIGASGTYEKTITLTVARDLKRQLELTGRYRVHLTRDSDVFLRLRDRVQKARDLKADLFISVHADSIGSPDLRGASIYTLSDTASDAEAAALAARENRADIIAGVDLSNESRDVAGILIDLAQRETMNRSASFAQVLVNELGREIRLQAVRPHRFAGFAVLKAPDVPAVLLELGYLSNREDEALLKQPAHRRRVALGVRRAVDAFFAQAAAR